MPVRSNGLPLLGLTADGREVTFPGDAHLLTVGRAGAGKNRRVILPNLIRYPGSVVVNDPKAENAEITAQWRERFGPVFVFDPFHAVPDHCLPSTGRASFDPVAFVAKADEPNDAAQMVADALLIPGDKDTHWVEAAKLVMGAVVLFVATSPAFERPDVVEFFKSFGVSRIRTMKTVWSIIADDRFQALQLEMLHSLDPFIAKQGSVLSGLRIVEEQGEDETTGKPYIRRVFGKVLNGKENEGKLSTLMTQVLGTFSSAKIMDCLSGETTVDLATLSRVPTSVYLCLPGKYATVHSRFMRLLNRCILAGIEDGGLSYPMPDGSRRPSTLFILDEFATLGRFPPITEAMGRMRGYGLKFWTFVQNLSQLKDHYGDTWTTIPGNVGVTQYFGGTADQFTAEYISKATGEMTATEKTRGDNTRPGQGVSTNERLYGRPVKFPGQIASLAPEKQLLMFLGLSGPFETGLMDRLDPRQFGDFIAWERTRASRPIARPLPDAAE